MKSLKQFFSSLLVVLTVCQFSPVQADQTDLPVYQNIIQDISLSYEDAMLIGSIKLDNDLTMRIVDYKTRDDNVMKTWQSGDAVGFQGHLRDDALVLSVGRIHTPKEDCVEAYVIFDVLNSGKSGLMITEISDEGKFVKLNDNSVWEFSWYNRLSTKNWSIGERVLVGGQGDKNSYDFINLDAPVSKHVYNATGSYIPL